MVCKGELKFLVRKKTYSTSGADKAIDYPACLNDLVFVKTRSKITNKHNANKSKHIAHTNINWLGFI